MCEMCKSDAIKAKLPFHFWCKWCVLVGIVDDSPGERKYDDDDDVCLLLTA